MRYLLALITHGQAPTLEATLDSFSEMVKPHPAHRIAAVDGADATLPPIRQGGAWETTQTPTREGFCATTRRLWRAAAEAAERYKLDFVFWLENDFTFLRPVDLHFLAGQLDADRRLAQMALMRTAANRLEEAAGGLYELRKGDYTPEHTNLPTVPQAFPWLRHRAYFTTNPSLMRAAFMRACPWGAWPSECEGRYTADLLPRGYDFGVWGAGEEWVRHDGTRTGHGY